MTSWYDSFLNYGYAKVGQKDSAPRLILLGCCSMLSFLNIFLIGFSFSSWSNTIKDTESVPWAVSLSNGNHVYYGLRYFYAANQKSLKSYEDSNCTGSFCRSCTHASQVALGLLILAFLLVVITLGLSIYRMKYNIGLVKLGNFLPIFLQILFILSAFATWNENCLKDLRKIDSVVILSHGYGLVVSALFFSIITFVIHLNIPITLDETSPV